jgi:hypothetical protein
MTTSGRKQKTKRGRPCSGPPEERLNGEPHFIERKEKGSVACVVHKATNCRKKHYITARHAVESHFYTR